MIAEAAPGEHDRRAFDKLVRRLPLARVVRVVGSWCESERRRAGDWPGTWREQGIDRALIYPGGHAPAGSLSTKVLWAFLSPKGKRLASGSLIVQGRRLDAPGKTWQQFVPIGYAGQNGAPSYASIVVLPAEGCWQVRLSAGAAHASVVFQATAAP